jgi:plasmid stabilization system protein ParE
VKLRYTLPALAELNSILDYIAAHSPRGAKRVQRRLQSIVDLLLAHPDIGIRTDDPAILAIFHETRSPAVRFLSEQGLSPERMSDLIGEGI